MGQILLFSKRCLLLQEKDYDYDVDDENACDEEFAPNCKYGAEYLDWLRNHVLCKEVAYWMKFFFELFFFFFIVFWFFAVGWWENMFLGKKEWTQKMIMYLINCFSLKQDFGKRYDDQVESNQKFSVEFETGTEYLQWLELQIPYEEVSDDLVLFTEVRSKSNYNFFGAYI